jgi:hypothetical protein
MKLTALLFVLAATCTIATMATMATTAAEPRCPLIPMGAITGRPDEQTVKETLEAYKAVGVDQYLIYPRSGLEYEYLGEEWLQVCQWFCKHAQRLDMSIWLYDEYNWPSGSCKGRVPAENPDFESRQYAVYKQADERRKGSGLACSVCVILPGIGVLPNA